MPTVRVTVSSANSTTLMVVNGNPAIGFGRNGNTRYIRASDADGNTWNSGTTIVTGLSNGTFTSLAVVAGSPCMAYYKFEDERVAFRRATDANGENWGAEITVHFVSGQVIGAYARVLEVDGFPAVAYQQVTSADVYYVRSANATGTSWLNPVVVDASDNVGRDITVHLVDGRPAIAYYDLTNDDLRFVRATNATGMGAGAWGTPITIDTYPRIGKYISQAIVEDRGTTRGPSLRALDSPALGHSITVDSWLRRVLQSGHRERAPGHRLFPRAGQRALCARQRCLGHKLGHLRGHGQQPKRSTRTGLVGGDRWSSGDRTDTRQKVWGRWEEWGGWVSEGWAPALNPTRRQRVESAVVAHVHRLVCTARSGERQPGHRLPGCHQHKPHVRSRHQCNRLYLGALSMQTRHFYIRSINSLHYVRSDDSNGSTWSTPVALSSAPIAVNFLCSSFHNMRRSPGTAR